MKHTMAYLEVWLNLGVVGLVIVLAFLLISYFNVCDRLRTLPTSAMLGLTFWIVLLFYDFTEAAF
jgi:O-antigen ligase